MKKKVPNIFEFHIINLLVGFFLVCLLPYFFGGFNIHYVTYPFRVISLILSLYVIIIGNSYKKFSLVSYLLVIFFALYAIRIFYDLFILKSSYQRENYEYIATFLGAVIIPSISICFIPKHLIRWKIIRSYFFLLLFLFAFCNSLFVSPTHSLSIRNSGITQLWPIGYGQSGVSLSLLSLFIYKKGIENNRIRWICILSFFIGLYVVLMSASKGPLLSLIILCGVYIVYYNFPKLFKDLYFLVILLSIIGILIFFFNDLMISTRIDGSLHVKDGSTIERLLILETTIKNIKNNFWFGDSFLIRTDSLNSVYPHNLFLEAFMAVGVFGGAIFIAINFIAITKSFKCLKVNKYQDWLVFLFFQYTLQTLFSSSIYSSAFYWILMMVVLFLLKEKNHVQKLH